MKKLLTYVSLLLLIFSCGSNKSVVAATSKAPEMKQTGFYLNYQKPTINTADEQSQGNVVKENNSNNTKPVVLKRTMRRPAVI